MILTNLHFKSSCEIFPRVVQLVTQHLHGEPLHDAGPGHDQLLVQADPALRQGLKLGSQFTVAPSVSFSNLRRRQCMT